MGTHVQFYPESDNYDREEWPKNWRLANIPRIGENVSIEMESGEWFWGRVERITWELSGKNRPFVNIILEEPEPGSY